MIGGSGDYDIVFDIERVTFEPWFAFGFLALAFAFAASIFLVQKRASRVVSGFAAAFFVLLSFAGGWLQYSELRRLQSALQNGDYMVIEGRVEAFNADNGRGNDPQTFTVANHGFSIIPGEVSPSFRDTVGRGGPNLSGKCVRIALTRYEEIIFLAVRRDGCEEQSLSR